MTRSRYYVLDGRVARPVESMEQWAKAFEGDRHVAQDTVGEIRVSTVFLGIDHSFGDGPPLIFETMIFGGPHDQHQTRCSTYGEAERQHQEALALARSGLN